MAEPRHRTLKESLKNTQRSSPTENKRLSNNYLSAQCVNQLSLFTGWGSSHEAFATQAEQLHCRAFSVCLQFTSGSQ